MRITGRQLSWLAVAVGAFFAGAPRAGAAEPTGIWKFEIHAVGAGEMAIVDLHRQDGQPAGVLVDGRSGLFDKARVEDVRFGDGRASFRLAGPRLAVKFDGMLVGDGPEAGKVMGTADLGNAIFPARLEKTTEDRLGPPKPDSFNQDYFAARNERDPKAAVGKFKALIEKNQHGPLTYALYEPMLEKAQAASMPAADVESLIAAWRRESAPYGAAWSAEVAKRALTAIAPQKDYAETALNLAKEVDAILPAEVSIETRADVVKLLAVAARNAGKAELAAGAESRAAKYDAQIDEEYHAKVPPFKPTPYEGKSGGQPVLFELFTGAQCPPCVGADVAFDALLKTYKPAQFIGLQYHLHIPGPDPMTSPDTTARARYYGDDLQGTPSTFFNGRSKAGGGGTMSMSEGKYAQYREVVEELLQEKPRADVSVSAKRTGDVVAITAETKSSGIKHDGQNSSIKLRLALTEETVRYVGGNKLRFHHHVVRAMPGGVEGAVISDGTGKVEISVDLAELRKKTEEYLADLGKQRPFPPPLPALDFKNLSVVAFVQDDHDRTVLGAASTPVAGATP